MRIALLAFVLTLSSPAWARSIPNLSGPVVDEAGLLSQGDVEAIAAGLGQFKQKTGNQLQVLIVKSLDGEVIEDFSIHVAEKWKIGTKGKDNGVLLLIAVDERSWRIEVGGGLEGELTDVLASRIGHGILVPAFKEGQFAAGIAQTLSAIASGLGSELVFPGNHGNFLHRSSEPPAWSRFLFFALFVFAFLLLSGRGGGFLPGLILGGLSGRRGSGSWGGGGGGWGGGGGGGWSGGGGGFSGGGASGKW